VSNIFRPGGDGAFSYRQFAKRQKQQYWGAPALQRRYDPPGEPRQRTLIKIWQHLHYLSSHAPANVEIRYRAAATRFDTRHFAGNKRNNGSTRFLNKYTAHRWM